MIVSLTTQRVKILGNIQSLDAIFIKRKNIKKKKKKVKYETDTEKPNNCPVVTSKRSFLHLVSVMTLVRLRTLLCYQDCSSLNFCDHHLFALQSIDRSNTDLVCDINISKKKVNLNLILKFCYPIWTMQLEDVMSAYLSLHVLKGSIHRSSKDTKTDQGKIGLQSSKTMKQ